MVRQDGVTLSHAEMRTVTVHVITSRLRPNGPVTTTTKPSAAAAEEIVADEVVADETSETEPAHDESQVEPTPEVEKV